MWLGYLNNFSFLFSTAQTFWKKRSSPLSRTSEVNSDVLTCTDFKIVEILLFDNLFNQFDNNRIRNAAISSIVLSKISDGTFFYSILSCEKMGNRQYDSQVLNFYFNLLALEFILFTYSS